MTSAFLEQVSGIGFFLTTGCSLDVNDRVDIAEGFIELVEIKQKSAPSEQQISVLRREGQTLIYNLK